MGGCSVLNCKKRSESKEVNLSFHSFPTDPTLKSKWIHATGRLNWTPSKNSRICSTHFNADEISVHKKNQIHLKSSAVPTKYKALVQSLQNDHLEIIPSTSSTKSKRKRQKSNDENISSQVQIDSYDCIKKVKSDLEEVQNLTAAQIANMSPSSKEVKLSATNVTCVKKMYLQLKKQKQISMNRKKKLLAVRESRRRLKKKVAKLENTILNLKSKMLINTKEAQVLSNIN